MKKVTILKRGMLIMVAVILLLTAVACCETGFRYVSSYEEAQRRFNLDAEPGMVYPDLSPFKFDESTVKYKVVPYDVSKEYIPKRPSPIREYIVFGSSLISDIPVHFSFSCHKGIFECKNIKDPVVYKDTEILKASYEIQNGYSSACSVFINGYEYTVGALYDYNEEVLESDFDVFRSDIEDLLFSFICGIIDEAQAEM